MIHPDPLQLPNRRILVIDDNVAIHSDFRKILTPLPGDSRFLENERAILGQPAQPLSPPGPSFEVDCAHQGKEGLELVRQAVRERRPYAVAFVDVRMPPGWNGLETAQQLWTETPALQLVLCTAYSDYSWAEILARLGHSDSLLVLKKPFDNMEVRQIVTVLARKWALHQAQKA